MLQAAKYAEEFALEFFSVDRFIFRASDVFTLDDYSSREQLDRLDNCHVYFLTKRPRLSLLPDSVDISADTVSFGAEWHVKGIIKQQRLRIPREWFDDAEHSFAISPYPHRELVSYDARGRAVMATLFANSVHLFEDLPSEVRDLEVVYIGKGLRNSARDRLVHHETLQRILGDIAAEDPGNEAFVVAHAFDYKKPYLLMRGMPVEITGHEALARHGKAAAYRPSLEEQVSLIEAAAISYFQTRKYNNHYLDFPRRHQRVLRPVYDADFAFLTVQVDHEKIGGQRLYSQKIPPASDHLAFVDFRRSEGRESVLGFRSE
ncbi:hypothetical protein [Bradyrhizobium sp. HKCCYLS20291]|uniref:hypothetical protein n=1 Tax=Bradyrhizobium sp. HKCCYLS20291 TaxID=3420766 RepID=UPI003EBEE369